MKTKGIILAGGKGTRLYPMTNIFSKQLQPVYDKPMIYYPLSTLMLAGIRDVLIISTPEDTPNYEKLLGNGRRFGINLQYSVQSNPGGLPEAFIIGEDFIGDSQVCLILGDNIFYGKLEFLREGLRSNRGGTIFAYQVENPGDYGVVEFNHNSQIISIEEKPKAPKSKYAIPGLYIFDSKVADYSRELAPSNRGEVEITDLHKRYLAENSLDVVTIGRGVAWLDTGTPHSLLEAGVFIQTIEKRQGTKIACLEEISLQQQFISIDDYLIITDDLPECDYKNYCRKIINEYK